MDGESVAAAILLALAVVLSMLTSAGEAALAHAFWRFGPRGLGNSLYAQMAQQLLDRHARTMAVLYGTRLVFLVIAVISLVALLRPMTQLPTALTGLAVAIVIVALALLPGLLKQALQPQSPRLVLAASPWLFFLTLLAAPMVRALGPLAPGERSPTPGIDLAHPLPASADGRVAHQCPPPHDDQERRMIQSILELDTTLAREIMTPRVDLVAIPATATLGEAAKLMLERGHSRLPVFEETVDHILGVVHARDLMAAMQSPSAQHTLKSLARPAIFVPETKRLNDLLREFQDKRVHIAIVVDEYGGTAGLVTVEDLVEEIVGELSDEFSHDMPEVQMTSAESALVHARTALETINEVFGSNLESEDVDTIGGYMFGLLGKLPAVGDKRESGGLVLEVAEMAGRRIRRVRVTRASPTPAALDHEHAGSAPQGQLPK